METIAMCVQLVIMETNVNYLVNLKRKQSSLVHAQSIAEMELNWSCLRIVGLLLMQKSQSQFAGIQSKLELNHVIKDLAEDFMENGQHGRLAPRPVFCH